MGAAAADDHADDLPALQKPVLESTAARGEAKTLKRGDRMAAKSPAKPADAPEVSAFSRLWTLYRVRMNFLTRLCSSVPADPELIQKWLEAQQPSVRPAGGRSIQEINEEVVNTLERPEEDEAPQYSMLVFQRDQGHLVMRAGTVKAHIKDAAAQISSFYVGKIKGEKSFAVRVKNCIYHDEHEYWLPIRRPDGAFITAPDGAFDKAIHVQTRQGKMNALKRFEYIAPPAYLEFTLKVMNAKVERAAKKNGERRTVIMPSMAEDDISLLFEYGGTHGYAGERGDGEGRYSFTIERLDAAGERTADSNG